MSLFQYAAGSILGGGGATPPQNLHWHRADVDGAPFRGIPPLMREDEYADKTRKVLEVRNGTYNTADPDQNAAYAAVMTKVHNNLYLLLYIDRWRLPEENAMRVYVEWAEVYVEER